MQDGAFLTGSRRYGTPRKDSDIDLVVPCGILEMQALAEIAKTEIQEIKHGETQTDPGPHSIAFNFGRLNLIMVCDEKAYKIWQKGTLQLVKAKDEGKKVTREKAIKHFARLRKHLAAKKK